MCFAIFTNITGWNWQLLCKCYLLVIKERDYFKTNLKETFKWQANPVTCNHSLSTQRTQCRTGQHWSRLNYTCYTKYIILCPIVLHFWWGMAALSQSAKMQAHIVSLGVPVWVPLTVGYGGLTKHSWRLCDHLGVIAATQGFTSTITIQILHG